jgi:hypothetical protein
MLILNLKVKYRPVALILPIALVLLLILLSSSQFFAAHNRNLSIAITLDLVFSIPLIHVLLSTRNNTLKYSTALFFTVGLIVAGFIIPKKNQFLLHEIKVWVVPVIEASSIIFFVIQTKKARSKHAALKKDSEDFYTVLKKVSGELLPAKLATVISAEISAFYYGFLNWKKIDYDNKNFSYHKKTGIIPLIGVLIFMILIETSVFHLLLAKWNVKVAWLVSGISVYAALQAFGIARSILKRPIQIINNRLIIPYGILAETAFDINDMASIGRYNKQLTDIENLRSLSLFKKLEEPGIILHLTKTHYIDGIYGSRKAFDKLLIHVDEKEVFIKQLQLLAQTSGS